MAKGHHRKRARKGMRSLDQRLDAYDRGGALADEEWWDKFLAENPDPSGKSWADRSLLDLKLGVGINWSDSQKSKINSRTNLIDKRFKAATRKRGKYSESSERRQRGKHSKTDLDLERFKANEGFDLTLNPTEFWGEDTDLKDVSMEELTAEEQLWFYEKILFRTPGPGEIQDHINKHPGTSMAYWMHGAVNELEERNKIAKRTGRRDFAASDDRVKAFQRHEESIQHAFLDSFPILDTAFEAVSGMVEGTLGMASDLTGIEEIEEYGRNAVPWILNAVMPGAGTAYAALDAANQPGSNFGDFAEPIARAVAIDKLGTGKYEFGDNRAVWSDNMMTNAVAEAGWTAAWGGNREEVLYSALTGASKTGEAASNLYLSTGLDMAAAAVVGQDVILSGISSAGGFILDDLYPEEILSKTGLTRGDIFRAYVDSKAPGASFQSKLLVTAMESAGEKYGSKFAESFRGGKSVDGQKPESSVKKNFKGSFRKEVVEMTKRDFETAADTIHKSYRGMVETYKPKNVLDFIKDRIGDIDPEYEEKRNKGDS